MSSIYPLKEMQVGDVIIMADKKRGTVNMAVYQYRQKVPESCFRVQIAMAGIAITRMPDRTDVVPPAPPEPVKETAYISTVDGKTVFHGPTTYEAARDAIGMYERIAEQKLIILMSENTI